MADLKKKTKKELLNYISFLIHGVLLNEKSGSTVITTFKERFYPNIKDDNHIEIKYFQAVNRIDFHLAYNIAKVPICNFDIHNFSDNRKMLLKFCKELENTSYETIRKLWAEKYYNIEREQRQIGREFELLKKKCILVRYQNKNVRIDDSHNLSLVENEAEMTEFMLPFKDIEKSIDFVKKMLEEEFHLNDGSLRCFTSNHEKGRIIY